ACYECAHEHGVGDRCIAFGLAPQLFEEIAAFVTGSSRFRFDTSMLPALPDTARALAAIETGAVVGGAMATEEFTIELAETVLHAASGVKPSRRAVSSRDERKVSHVLRHIE